MKNPKYNREIQSGDFLQMFKISFEKMFKISFKKVPKSLKESFFKVEKSF